MAFDGITCRFCGSKDLAEVINLGVQPPSNSFLAKDQLLKVEPHYALLALHCGGCGLVQVPEVAAASEIFSDYLYFSSYSESWLAHARRYVDAVTKRFALDAKSRVVEVASNDGYLLQYFVQKGIPVLGIEPAANVAAVARQKGVDTRADFFTHGLAKELVAGGLRADLIVGNNVLAHVPQINNFVAGLKELLAANGVITMEFPHIVRLVEETQFDTIYHEHYSYYALLVVQKMFAAHGLRIFDVEQIPTHGGSLRIFACHTDAPRPTEAAVAQLAKLEIDGGYDKRERYLEFGRQVYALKRDLLEFLIGLKRANKSIAAYGAAAKGNTLLNFLGVRTDFIDFVVDRNPEKQGRFLPGSRIPIFAPDVIAERRPDYLVILPWNLRDEVASQMSEIRRWGGKFVTLIPTPREF